MHSKSFFYRIVWRLRILALILRLLQASQAASVFFGRCGRALRGDELLSGESVAARGRIGRRNVLFLPLAISLDGLDIFQGISGTVETLGDHVDEDETS